MWQHLFARQKGFDRKGPYEIYEGIFRKVASEHPPEGGSLYMHLNPGLASLYLNALEDRLARKSSYVWLSSGPWMSREEAEFRLQCVLQEVPETQDVFYPM